MILPTLLIVASAFTFSWMTFVVQILGQKGMKATEILLVRCIVQAIYSATWCAFIRTNPFGPPGKRFWPSVRGLAGAVSAGCLYYGATTIAISDATVLQFSTPIWVPFIAFAMIREPITLTHMIATFFGISGVILIAQPAFIFGMKDSEDSTLNLAQPGSKEYLIASLVCVIGAMFAGLVYTIIRKTGVSIHFQVMVFYYGFVGGFAVFLQVMIFERPIPIPADVETWVLLGAVCALACIGQTCLNFGAQRTAASKTAMLRNLDIAFVLLWQILLLGQLPTLWSTLGLILLTSVTIFVSLRKSAPVPVKEEKQPTDGIISIELDTIVDGTNEDESEENLSATDQLITTTEPVSNDQEQTVELSIEKEEQDDNQPLVSNEESVDIQLR